MFSETDFYEFISEIVAGLERASPAHLRLHLDPHSIHRILNNSRSAESLGLLEYTTTLVYWFIRIRPISILDKDPEVPEKFSDYSNESAAVIVIISSFMSVNLSFRLSSADSGELIHYLSSVNLTQHGLKSYLRLQLRKARSSHNSTRFRVPRNTRLRSIGRKGC